MARGGGNCSNYKTVGNREDKHRVSVTNGTVLLRLIFFGKLLSDVIVNLQTSPVNRAVQLMRKLMLKQQMNR